MDIKRSTIIIDIDNDGVISYDEFQEFFVTLNLSNNISNNIMINYSTDRIENMNKNIELTLIEKIPINQASIPREIPEQIRSMMLADMSIVPHIKLVYKDFSLDITEESVGTQKLLNFICPLIDIFENGKIFVCDEIEKHLHPIIVRHLVELFIKNKKSDAQIIVTTHDIDLLDLDLLRRDQIWFTSINPEVRKTDLYSLSSLKNVRKDENIKKNYLKGKYNLY